MAVAACSPDPAPARPSPAAAPGRPVSPASSASPAQAPAATASRLPRPDHVLIAVFENKSYEQVAGSSNAPYLNEVMAQSAVFTRARGITHPSQPNYVALFAGSTYGVRSNHCPTRLGDRPNLGRQLLDAELSFAGYSEDLPAAGFSGCSYGRYAAKHNPWVDFTNIPPSANLPYRDLPTDYSRLPTVSFVIPNLCHDMHDCSVAVGDRWARDHLDGYLRWAKTHNSLLIITFDENDITFDENDGDPGNHILTLFAGAGVKPGRYAEAVDHYRVLATIEEMYGLPRLNEAAKTSPIADVWRR
ncbi:MAG: acid phosphatase [Micromonosporaceae bacterium]|nr:acid phosphatase [Micromonosporaceae bacterium]